MRRIGTVDDTGEVLVSLSSNEYETLIQLMRAIHQPGDSRGTALSAEELETVQKRAFKVIWAVAQAIDEPRLDGHVQPLIQVNRQIEVNGLVVVPFR